METTKQKKAGISIDWWANICAFAVTALVLLGIIPGVPW